MYVQAVITYYILRQGKATILNIFPYSQFISDTNMLGLLHHTNTSIKENGFSPVGTYY